jgi:hypothetical protein
MRQRGWIEDEDGIDVRRVVELMASLFAQRDRRKPTRLRPRHSLDNRPGNRRVERIIRKIRQCAGHRGEIELPRQITDRCRQRQSPPLNPQSAGQRHGWIVDLRRGKWIAYRICDVADQCLLTLDQMSQEGRIARSTFDCVGNRRVRSSHPIIVSAGDQTVSDLSSNKFAKETFCIAWVPKHLDRLPGNAIAAIGWKRHARPTRSASFCVRPIWTTGTCLRICRNCWAG